MLIDIVFFFTAKITLDKYQVQMVVKFLIHYLEKSNIFWFVTLQLTTWLLSLNYFYKK